MAYEKYIKKDGKLYGPYLYESKRVDGRVVSEYHGQSKPQFLKFLWFVPLVALIIFGAYLIGHGNRATGYSILGINADYQSGQPLSGNLNFQLQQGEFVPADSTIVFENGGQQYEYPLAEVYSEQPIIGDFFINGKILSGNGSGFGIAGMREIYPEVSFVLLIYSITNNTDTESVTEISGITSKDKSFTYKFQNGERAELKPLSVRVQNSNPRQLNDNDVSLTTENNLVSVTTNYHEEESGFGADYLGPQTKDISIDLKKLNLTLQEGQLNIFIKYNGEELVSLPTTIGTSSDISANTPAAQIQQPTETIPENTANTNEILPISLGLTQQEQSILKDKFGNTEIAVKEATIKNGFITVRYELGDFWIENSYSADISNETLNLFIEEDKGKFLKDIAQSFLQTQESGKAIVLP